MAELAKICLTLTGATLEEDVALAQKYSGNCDLLELRIDRLGRDEWQRVAAFPAMVEHPVILTARRVCDGGTFAPEAEDERLRLLEALTAFDYVDLESDLDAIWLERLAEENGTRVIRSIHRFDGFDSDEAASIDAIKRKDDEIPKLAFKANSLRDLTAFKRIADQLPPGERIFCAMGAVGAATRILPQKFGSMLTFASPPEATTTMAGIGHIDVIRLDCVFKVRDTGSRTRLTGVTGWPLHVTASPEIHRELCERDGIDSAMVTLPSDNIDDAIQLAEALGLSGLAVTVPHKETLLPLLDETTPAVKAVGAANTVVWRDGKRFGDNTDIGGFSDAVTAFAGRTDFNGMRVAVIGSGGASRAVAYALGHLGANGTVFARNEERAREIAALGGFASAPLESIGSSCGWDLIVQCTSVGNGSENPDDDPAPGYVFSGRELVYDLIYKPAATPFLKRACKAGCRIENGMSMLRAQAERQHAMWMASGEKRFCNSSVK